MDDNWGVSAVPLKSLSIRKGVRVARIGQKKVVIVGARETVVTDAADFNHFPNTSAVAVGNSMIDVELLDRSVVDRLLNAEVLVDHATFRPLSVEMENSDFLSRFAQPRRHNSFADRVSRLIREADTLVVLMNRANGVEISRAGRFGLNVIEQSFSEAPCLTWFVCANRTRLAFSRGDRKIYARLDVESCERSTTSALQLGLEQLCYCLWLLRVGVPDALLDRSHLSTLTVNLPERAATAEISRQESGAGSNRRLGVVLRYGVGCDSGLPRRLSPSAGDLRSVSALVCVERLPAGSSTMPDWYFASDRGELIPLRGTGGAGYKRGRTRVHLIADAAVLTAKYGRLANSLIRWDAGFSLAYLEFSAHAVGLRCSDLQAGSLTSEERINLGIAPESTHTPLLCSVLLSQSTCQIGMLSSGLFQLLRHRRSVRDFSSFVPNETELNMLEGQTATWLDRSIVSRASLVIFRLVLADATVPDQFILTELDFPSLVVKEPIASPKTIRYSLMQSSLRGAAVLYLIGAKGVAEPQCSERHSLNAISAGAVACYLWLSASKCGLVGTVSGDADAPEYEWQEKLDVPAIAVCIGGPLAQ